MTDAVTVVPHSAVLHVGGLHYASEKAVVEQVLGRRPGVISVEANPVAQTATVVYDPDSTSVEALREWVRDCRYHCAGQSVPGHMCDPLVAPDHGPHDHEAAARADERRCAYPAATSATIEPEPARLAPGRAAHPVRTWAVSL